MDGTAAIQDNRQALMRIVAGLFAMAGLAGAAPGGGANNILPRHLRLAILRLLRPAEAAARRLILAASRGLAVALPPRRAARPVPASAEPFLRRFGIAVVVPPGGLAAAASGRAVARAAARGVPGFALCDPPRRFRGPARGSTRRAAPRILLPGLARPFALPPPPAPDDPMDATRLGVRLAALAAALDDLPGQARRFARWQAFRDRRREARGLAGRASPLRPGRPPGGRLWRYDPAAPRRAGIRDVDAVLAHAHALALYALQHPDSS